MTIQEINTMLGQTGLPKTYYSWPEDDPANPVPPLPYLVWYFPDSDNFAADDQVHAHIETLTIELYTAQKDFETEAAVEAILADIGNHVAHAHNATLERRRSELLDFLRIFGASSNVFIELVERRTIAEIEHLLRELPVVA